MFQMNLQPMIVIHYCLLLIDKLNLWSFQDNQFGLIHIFQTFLIRHGKIVSIYDGWHDD